MTRYEEAKAAGFPHRGLIFCHTCGGSYIEVGVSGGREVPHADDCPRSPSKEWRPEEQDREAAALRHLEAPFPIVDDYFHDPFECPDPTGDHCEQARRRALAREGIRIPGLSPAGPAPYELTAPEPRERKRARRLTPNYGDDGIR